MNLGEIHFIALNPLTQNPNPQTPYEKIVNILPKTLVGADYENEI